MLESLISGNFLPPQISFPIVVVMAILLLFDRVGSFLSESFGRGKKYRLIKQKLEIIRVYENTFKDSDKKISIPEEIFRDIENFLGYEPEDIEESSRKKSSYFVKTLRVGFLIGIIVACIFFIGALFDGSMSLASSIGLSVSMTITVIILTFIFSYLYYIIRYFYFRLKRNS